MRKPKSQKFRSIRVKLFLQIGAIFLLAVLFLLALNRWYMPVIYTYTTRRNMREIAEQIDVLDPTAADFGARLSSFEKGEGLSIDLYTADGKQLYHGKDPLFVAGGKVTVTERREYKDGSYFETQLFERQNTKFIVYVRTLKNGCTLEMYSKKSTVDNNADSAVWVMTVTSIAALSAALLAVYFYSKRFTKPLIEMRNVTKGIAQTDFSRKCSAETADEIGELAGSINQLSASLEETLADLSEKNRKLQNDIAREQRVDKMRKDFIANVSHELKTPISIVQGYAEGAKLLAQSGSGEKAGEYCDIIIAEAQRMNRLVLELLELSQYESGGMSVQAQVFDLYALVSEYVRANQLKFEEKGIDFSFSLPQNCMCFADRIKIQMVLNNYISNACAHASGGKAVRLTAEFTDATHCRVTVFNEGAPIADEDLGKIWDSFYRADKAHSRKEGRYGLGLSIVSEIQKLHGQARGVQNVPNGVEFWFDIQRVPSEG